MNADARRLAGIVLAIGVLGACDQTPTSLSNQDGGQVGGATLAATEVCTVIDFEEFTSNGDPVNSLTVFGETITVTTTSFSSNGTAGAGSNQAVVIDGNLSHPEDKDLTAVDGGFCAGCAAQGKILIIEDPDGFATQGDTRYGGTVALTGFGAIGDDVYLKSLTFVDVDKEQDPNEPESRVDADGTTVAVAPETGDGGVATGVGTDKEILIDKIELVHAYQTSGGWDDLEICKSEPNGGAGQGCTPGYWKQSQHFSDWIGYNPTDSFGSVFDLPSQLERPEHNVDPSGLTLEDALRLRGGGVNALMRHAVAALLNAANPDVSYDFTESDVIFRFNSVVNGSDEAIEGQKDQFADFNEQGCPL